MRVVITESYERIHRSNLIGMGVIPLEFKDGVSRKTLGLKGDERIDVTGLQSITPGQDIKVKITYGNGDIKEIITRCRIDTATEMDYYRHGGILHYVIRQMLH